MEEVELVHTCSHLSPQSEQQRGILPLPWVAWTSGHTLFPFQRNLFRKLNIGQWSLTHLSCKVPYQLSMVTKGVKRKITINNLKFFLAIHFLLHTFILRRRFRMLLLTECPSFSNPWELWENHGICEWNEGPFSRSLKIIQRRQMAPEEATAL